MPSAYRCWCPRRHRPERRRATYRSTRRPMTAPPRPHRPSERRWLVLPATQKRWTTESPHLHCRQADPSTRWAILRAMAPGRRHERDRETTIRAPGNRRRWLRLDLRPDQRRLVPGYARSAWRLERCDRARCPSKAQACPHRRAIPRLHDERHRGPPGRPSAAPAQSFRVRHWQDHQCCCLRYSQRRRLPRRRRLYRGCRSSASAGRPGPLDRNCGGKASSPSARADWGECRRDRGEPSRRSAAPTRRLCSNRPAAPAPAGPARHCRAMRPSGQWCAGRPCVRATRKCR